MPQTADSADSQQGASALPDEYSAGESGYQLDIPDFLVELESQIMAVREKRSDLENERYSMMSANGPRMKEMSPIEMIQWQQSTDALWAEEQRLMKELQELSPLIPPLMEAPHNGRLSAHKAKEILGHGMVHGEPLTTKQKRFFGAVAGGQKPYSK